ncbi:unnamed protein product, partial [Brachionus calyciflorus]
MIINNDGIFSQSIKTKVGVRQGGIASPKLFSIYIESLLEEIERDKNGLQLTNTKIDVLAYADDLLLLSTTKKGLQELLNIVTSFGSKNEVKFNPDKTIYLTFNNKISRTKSEKLMDIWNGDLTLDGRDIRKSNELKYLGVIMNDENSDKPHLERRKKATQSALAKLKSVDIINEKTNPYLKGFLYKSYIMPVLYYGMETVHLTKNVMNEIRRFEDNMLKSIYGISKYCRSTNL